MPLTRRQIYGRRRMAVFGGVLLVLLAGIYLPLTLLAPLASAHAEVPAHSVDTGKAPTITWPQFGSSAFGAVGYDDLSQTSGSDAQLPIASISKIVTALVTLQAKPLTVGDEGPTITFTADDHDLYAHYLSLDGTVKPMPTGASMSEHQVLQVALIASANNYAATLADWAFGSETAYATAAAAWLKANGLDHTTLVEPTGINPANTSTASDLVTLGKLALANPVLAAIVDTPTITMPIVGTIDDTNKLLGKEGVVGIKTGTLSTSSLLFASRYKVGTATVTIVGAVLGAPDRTSLYPAVTALLKEIKSGFRSVELVTKGHALIDYTTAWRESSDARATSTRKVLVWAGTRVKTVITPTSLRLAKKGDAGGSAVFTVGSTTIKLPLTLDHALSDPGPWWRLGNPLALLAPN
jgi:D-alanyl-D-alanine carboxypeptidase (penicillin-binding protein 5/6)